jgi:protein TonB
VGDRLLITAFATSSIIHLGMLPLMALVIHTKPSAPIMMPIAVIDAPKVEESKKPEVTTAPPRPKPKAEKITAPKLLSKPTIFDTPPIAAPDNTPAEIKEPEKAPKERPKLASRSESSGAVKAGWNVGNKSADAEGSAAGAGNFFSSEDIGVASSSGTAGGTGGRGNFGLGHGTKGDGTGGGGSGAGGPLSRLARPLGGYQVRPRYPESARRAGAQGTTLLKLRVLENGLVGEVLIEQSAGHQDLDNAAADAVKKWLFEPARMGKEPIAVWVLLPVKFELQRGEK